MAQPGNTGLRRIVNATYYSVARLRGAWRPTRGGPLEVQRARRDARKRCGPARIDARTRRCCAVASLACRLLREPRAGSERASRTNRSPLDFRYAAASAHYPPAGASNLSDRGEAPALSAHAAQATRVRTTVKLFAGMLTTSASSKPQRRAQRSTSSRSRTPHSALRARRL